LVDVQKIAGLAQLLRHAYQFNLFDMAVNLNRFHLCFAILAIALSGPLKCLSQSRKDNLHVTISVPVQNDYQEMVSGASQTKQLATAVNFGLRLQLHANVSRHVSVSAGIGYFRERFNIRRGYDHVQLNLGRDSFLVYTLTKYYAYRLLEFPLTFTFLFTPNIRSAGLSLTYIPAFSISTLYEGGVAIYGANKVYSGTRFYSHSVLVSGLIPVTVGRRYFSIEPYIRVVRSYKKDKYLYENPNEYTNRSLDAIGVSFAYHLSVHRIKPII
jgi:hypothetical protein